jgi:hypothetical protein
LPEAAIIVPRAGAPLDWIALADIARRTKLEQRLRLGLDYLRTTIGLPIPEAALARISRRPRLVERVEGRAFRGMMESDSARRQTWFDMLAMTARLAASEDRIRLPGLGLRWLSRQTPWRGQSP